VKVPRICQIVRRVLKNKDALDEIQAQSVKIELQKSSTKRVVKQMIAENAHIDTALTV